jgi:ArsR family transcriptional regulator
VNIRRLSQRESDELVLLAKALSDANRLEILRLLAAQGGPVCACDIVDSFDLGQPTVSHHLKTLKSAGLLQSEKRGLWMFYRLSPNSAALLDKLAALADAVPQVQSCA